MAIPSTHQRPAVPRRVILFGFFLGASLAVLGLVGSHLVDQLNDDYVKITSTQLPSLALIRDINKAQGQGRLLLQPVTDRITVDGLNEIKLAVRSIREKNTERLYRLGELLTDDKEQVLLHELRKVRMDYHVECDRFLSALASRSDEYALELQRLAMLRADAKYVEAQDMLGDYCERRATLQGAILAERSKNLNRFFFVVAAWPLVLAVSFFVFGLLSTVVMFYQRRKYF
jgi:hypothetical protein